MKTYNVYLIDRENRKWFSPKVSKDCKNLEEIVTSARIEMANSPTFVSCMIKELREITVRKFNK